MGKRHGIDLGTPEALRRGVMHLFNVDFALEFPRKLPPNVKLVGPLMPEPAKPLPADLEVSTCPKHSILSGPQSCSITVPGRKCPKSRVWTCQCA